MSSIRLLVIDRHEIVRAGINLMCNDCADLQVVAEYSSLRDAREAGPPSAADLIILDPASDPTAEPTAIVGLRTEFPGSKFLIFTANDRAGFANHCVDSGMMGFLVKSARMSELSVAIRSIHEGRVFISHTHSSVPRPKLVDATFRQSYDSLPEQSPAVLPELSSREREVLTLLSDGATNKQVAGQLFLSVKTVETYRARIMKKFSLRDRADLIRFARQTVTQLAMPA